MTYIGREDAALVLIQEAVERDPLDLMLLVNLARANSRVGNVDDARSQLEAAIEIDPESSYVQFGWFEWEQGNFEEALRISYELEGDRRLRAVALHSLGKYSEAQVELDHFLRHDTTPAFQVAEIYACWGDVDKAFQWLENAYESHDPDLLALRGNFRMRSLHDDHRWAALLEDLGISDAQIKKLEL